MVLLKLTIASGPDKGTAVYIKRDDISWFLPRVERSKLDGYGRENGTQIMLNNQMSIDVEESVKDLIDLLQQRSCLEISYITK